MLLWILLDTSFFGFAPRELQQEQNSTYTEAVSPSISSRNIFEKLSILMKSLNNHQVRFISRLGPTDLGMFIVKLQLLVCLKGYRTCMMKISREFASHER